MCQFLDMHYSNCDYGEHALELTYLGAFYNKFYQLLYLYRARNKITQLSIPTHVQLQRHRLKFIKI